MIRMVRIFLPHKRKNNVVGIKIAAGFKIFITLEFNAFA
ncbi:Uncharacterised protein [Klebsiella michiganensis]|nr:Uncharacterised protein [Klebsiella michiganensis]